LCSRDFDDSQAQHDLERAQDELGAELSKIAPAREAKPAA
jgi:hypothetical protein